MPYTDRPRNSIEVLIEGLLFDDDTGGRGIGPTLGFHAPAPDVRSPDEELARRPGTPGLRLGRARGR